MTASSLDAAYFDAIFAGDDDPWDLASSAYEAEKFTRTHDVLADRRYARALEVGCAHAVLTRRLAVLCDALLAVDISTGALVRARDRVGDCPGVSLQHMAFPREAPGESFDLVVLSEVAYYWSLGDLDRAADWLRDHVAPDGRIILVHFTGETDYPQSGDDAVAALWAQLGDAFDEELAERHERYRLDLWRRPH
jgi:SAM-dependent methyltransferase